MTREHERHPEQRDLPEQDHRDGEERQQTGERDRRLTALAGEPGHDALRPLAARLGLAPRAPAAPRSRQARRHRPEHGVAGAPAAGMPVFTADSSAKKSAATVVWSTGTGTTRRARSGLHLELARSAVEQHDTSGGSTLRRSHSEHSRETPRSETTSGVVTIRTVSAISAAIALASLRVAPASTIVRSSRVRIAVRMLRAAAAVTDSACSPSWGPSRTRMPWRACTASPGDGGW